VHPIDLETTFTAGFRRLATGHLLSASTDGLSVRVPGSGEMLLATWQENERDATTGQVRVSSLPTTESIAALHAGIYLARPDAGAVAVTSPLGVRLLAQRGEWLPPLFDEQVRHVGLGRIAQLDEAHLSIDVVSKTFAHGANAALLGDRLICIGITGERAVFNTELLEKCARAFAIVKAAGAHAQVIPAWVRFIATRRLKRDQSRAAESYRVGHMPAPTQGY
jgi:ribulose-5-phosphate 4-epimerase/fuculose-1-phosphate aldolase